MPLSTPFPSSTLAPPYSSLSSSDLSLLKIHVKTKRCTCTALRSSLWPQNNGRISFLLRFYLISPRSSLSPFHRSPSFCPMSLSLSLHRLLEMASVRNKKITISLYFIGLMWLDPKMLTSLNTNPEKYLEMQKKYLLDIFLCILTFHWTIAGGHFLKQMESFLVVWLLRPQDWSKETPSEETSFFCCA